MTLQYDDWPFNTSAGVTITNTQPVSLRELQYFVYSGGQVVALVGESAIQMTLAPGQVYTTTAGFIIPTGPPFIFAAQGRP